MKKSIKKWMAVLLMAVMVMALVGCGKKGGDKETDANPTEAPDKKEEVDNNEDEKDVVDDSSEVDDTYEAFDMNQRTIKVGLWWDYFYDSSHTDISDNPNVDNVETAQMKLDTLRYIEEKYNVRIEFVNLGWDGIIESINTSITAGTPDCDIYLTDLQFGIPAVVNGLAQDLAKVANPNSDMLGKQDILKSLEALGGTYLFKEQGVESAGIFLGYNSTMIEDLGLEDPQELYRKGEWTWDKFAEFALAGTRDTDSDGTVDVYGFGGIFTDLTNGIIMSNGGNIAGGKTEALSSNATTEAIEFISKLYNDDKSARPWSDDWNDNLLAWSDGKVMFWTAQSWSLKQEADAAIAEGAELPFEYRVVPYPTGPSGDGVAYSPVSGNWYFVPVGVAEPEKVVQVFEEFSNWHKGDPEYRDDLAWLESCFQREEDLEICILTGQNLKLDPWGSMPGYDYGATIWWPIIVNKEATVSQAVESAKTVLQDALDAFWGN